MKRLFTFAIALMSLFSVMQLTNAATAVFNVTVPDGTNACYIMGNFTGTNWPIADAVKCTKVDATHYTVTLDEANFKDGATLATLKYKYLSGPADWSYVEKDAAGAEISDRTFTADPQNDIVAKWAMAWADIPPLPLKLEINVMTPVGTVECYIVGNFTDWTWNPAASVDSCKMVKTDESVDGVVFTKTVYTADANKLQYHFCSGPAWVYEQTPSSNFVYPQISPVVEAWKVVYNPALIADMTITATVPAGTQRAWAEGDFNGWDMSKAVEGTKVNETTFTFVIPHVFATSYKLYNRADFGFPEADASGNELANRTSIINDEASKAITVIGWKQASNTAVPAINMANYKIHTASHSIVVEGVTSQVDIFDVSGRAVQSQKVVGTFSSKNLSSGLYIIRVDGATTKVSLR